jgi:hypothetical protein
MKMEAVSVAICWMHEVALIKKKPDPSLGIEIYELPGGMITENGSIEDCAARLVRRQTGVEIGSGGLEKFRELNVKIDYDGGKRDARLTLYTCRVFGGQFGLNAQSHPKWMAIEYVLKGNHKLKYIADGVENDAIAMLCDYYSKGALRQSMSE